MPTSRLISLILIALTVVGGLILALAGDAAWFPERSSTVAASVDIVFHVITWISIFFFVLIVAVMIWFVGEYHTGRAPKATSSVTHNTPLELTWTIIPLVLVIAIFYVGMRGYLHLRHPPLGAYEVRVTAQKWSWTFEHPNGASEANILRVPLNRPVRLTMTSPDVLHALFIPGFRVKQDIVPGRYTSLWFEATREGEFDLYCAEYCGKDHSLMRAVVIVSQEAVFEQQLIEVANEADRLSDEQLAVYALQKLFPRCSSCHTLDGKTSTGPSWRETSELWGKERVFADGTRAIVDENYVRDSILNPAAHIVANYTNAMPTFKGQLNDRQVLALILAIRNLTDITDNTGKLLPDAAVDAEVPGGFPGASPDGPPKPPATQPAPGSTAAAEPTG